MFQERPGQLDLFQGRRRATREVEDHGVPRDATHGPAGEGQGMPPLGADQFADARRFPFDDPTRCLGCGIAGAKARPAAGKHQRHAFLRRVPQIRLQGLGIETISTVEWGVHRIADLLAYSSLDVTVSIGHGGVDLVEAEVPRLLVGRTVAELAIPGEAHVIALSREGRTVLPTQGTVLEGGDRVHLVMLASAVGRLKRLLGID